MALYEVPTGPSQRVMTIGLAGTLYTLRLSYADAPEGGWFMDLSDGTGSPLVCGVPLVTGADLLAQFPDLGVGGGLVVVSDQAGSVPSFAGLGSAARLLFGDVTDIEAIDDGYANRFAARTA